MTYAVNVKAVKSNYDRHISVLHGVGDFKAFPCNICGKVLGQKAHLDEHMTGVHGVGVRFSCHICSKVIVRKRNLIKHMSRYH